MWVSKNDVFTRLYRGDVISLLKTWYKPHTSCKHAKSMKPLQVFSVSATKPLSFLPFSENFLILLRQIPKLEAYNVRLFSVADFVLKSI